MIARLPLLENALHRVLIAALLATAPLASPPPALAQVSAGIAALLRQAEFWKARGRNDRAQQALRRVLAIDPNNEAARRALAASEAPAASSSPPRQAQVASPAAPRANIPKQARAAATPAQTADRAGQARVAGFAALEDGKLDLAQRHFQAALRIDPNDSDALGGLGLVRLRSGQFTEARTLLTRASRGGSAGKWSDALQAATFYGQLRTAQTARDQGRLQDAETLTRALAPNDAQQDSLARNLLGDIFARQGRYAEAQQIYRSIAGEAGMAGAASVAELQGRAMRIQAMQAVAAGDIAGAERLFQSALIAGASDPWLRYDYARFLLAQGRGPAADALMAPLSRATAPDGLYAAALFAAQVGRGRDARALMTLIPPAQRTPPMNAFLIELHANDAIAQARALQARGRTAEGINGLRQLAAQPLPLVAQGAVADTLYTFGDVPTALGVVQQALLQPLGGPDNYQGIIVVLGKSGQDGMAASLIQRLAMEARQNPLDNRSIARLSALLGASQGDRMRLAGDYATAFEVLQAAWASAPGDIDILASLARLYQSGNLNGQAAQVYGMLLQQRPNDVGTLIGLSDASNAIGDHDRAAQAIGTALRLAPAAPDVYLAAARMEQARGKKGAALRYLKRARELRARETSVAASGLFSPTNPFARTAPPATTLNPFALPSRPGGAAPTQLPQFFPAPITPSSTPGIYGGMSLDQGAQG
ncbi:hypothetical protein CLG96_05150 [Sphingomonas oleivorans]|uniref:Cellulose synthase n=1 Tax=Sphingomonas oleivorans TaxID=1735121 RepID=A0A2T5G2V7_9SPHN|nr:tetratricopeptide repeat protein [Sphingomonas oleivorans]PTQ13476.1 hypothetical protein CLG96_05150 [Sphingomonas oleivorans]